MEVHQHGLLRLHCRSSGLEAAGVREVDTLVLLLVLLLGVAGGGIGGPLCSQDR